MRIHNKELEKTIELVADPNTPEKVWLPACGAVGNTDLAPTKKETPVSASSRVLGGFVTNSSLIWGQLLGFFLLMHLSGCIANAVCGVDMSVFVTKLGHENSLLPQFLASLGFVSGWSGMSGRAKGIFRGVVFAVLSFLAVLSILTANTGFIFVAIAAASFILMEKFADFFRGFLPKNVSSSAVIRSVGWANFPVAALSMFATVKALGHCLCKSAASCALGSGISGTAAGTAGAAATGATVAATGATVAATGATVAATGATAAATGATAAATGATVAATGATAAATGATAAATGATAAATGATAAAAGTAAAATGTAAATVASGCAVPEASVGLLMCGITTVFLVFFVQSFFVAKATKAKSAGACAALALGMQSPAIFAMLLMMVGTTILGLSQFVAGDALINALSYGCCSKLDPRIVAQFWWTQPVFIPCGLAVMGGATVAGAAAGAYSNKLDKRFHPLGMVKARLGLAKEQAV